MYGRDGASAAEMERIVRSVTRALSEADPRIISSVYYTPEETRTRFGIVDFKIARGDELVSRGVELSSASSMSVLNQIVGAFDEFNVESQFITSSREQAIGMPDVRRRREGA